MKKRSLLLLTTILFTASIMQSCKKSSTDDTTTATAVLFQDYVNGTLWTPTSTTTVLTYSATGKNKTLVCTAINTANSDKLVFTIILASSNADNTFTPQTYTVNGSTVTGMYYTLVNNVYTAVGSPAGGNVIISTFDSTANTMTGTFAFNFTKNNYDSSGNLTSITSNGVSAGQFNSLPFTFVKQ